MTVHTNIGRRLELLACLLEHEASVGRGMGVVSVGSRVDREKSQISRGLAALSREGLVERDPENLEFAVGPVLLALAARAGSPDLLVLAQPVLERLAAELGERSDLAVLDGAQVLTIDSVAASSSVQSVGWTGRRTPLHCTAAGRVLVCGMPEAEIDDLLGPDPLPVAGPNGPTNRAEFHARLADTRRDGWAVADRELDLDVVAVAAPVLGRNGAVRAAITVACPAFRVGTRLDDIVESVRRAAAGLSATSEPRG